MVYAVTSSTETSVFALDGLAELLVDVLRARARLRLCLWLHLLIVKPSLTSRQTPG